MPALTVTAPVSKSWAALFAFGSPSISKDYLDGLAAPVLRNRELAGVFLVSEHAVDVVGGRQARDCDRCGVRNRDRGAVLRAHDVDEVVAGLPVVPAGRS